MKDGLLSCVASNDLCWRVNRKVIIRCLCCYLLCQRCCEVANKRRTREEDSAADDICCVRTGIVGFVLGDSLTSESGIRGNLGGVWPQIFGEVVQAHREGVILEILANSWKIHDNFHASILQDLLWANS